MDNAPDRALGPIVTISEVTLHCVEGIHAGERGSAPNLRLANNWLRLWAEDAPRGGAYDKVDFVIVWHDGHQYRGRYDLHHPSHEEPNLVADMRRRCRFWSGDWCPPHSTPEEYGALIHGVDPGVLAYHRDLYDGYQLD